MLPGLLKTYKFVVMKSLNCNVESSIIPAGGICHVINPTFVNLYITPHTQACVLPKVPCGTYQFAICEHFYISSQFPMLLSHSTGIATITLIDVVLKVF